MHERKLVFDQEQHNPCLKEQNLTQKCFNDNNYDKEKCQMHMYNYKTCKEFWVSFFSKNYLNFTGTFLIIELCQVGKEEEKY